MSFSDKSTDEVDFSRVGEDNERSRGEVLSLFFVFDLNFRF